MAYPTIDINTSGVADGDIGPGQAYRPLRYTTTEADSIRVGLWMVLSTELGAYTLDINSGLNVLRILDVSTSDVERAAIVRELVLAYPGVTGIVGEPAVTAEDQVVTIEVTVLVGDVSFTLAIGS